MFFCCVLCVDDTFLFFIMMREEAMIFMLCMYVENKDAQIPFRVGSYLRPASRGTERGVRPDKEETTLLIVTNHHIILVVTKTQTPTNNKREKKIKIYTSIE